MLSHKGDFILRKKAAWNSVDIQIGVCTGWENKKRHLIAGGAVEVPCPPSSSTDVPGAPLTSTCPAPSSQGTKKTLC